jgi:hypothetical protein
MSSSQLTSIFFRGVGIPPTRMFLEMGKIWTDHGEFGVEIF